MLLVSLIRSLGFLSDEIGLIGALMNGFAVYVQHEKESTEFSEYFGLLCFGSLLLGVANGFAQVMVLNK